MKISYLQAYERYSPSEDKYLREITQDDIVKKINDIIDKLQEIELRLDSLDE